MHIEGEGADVLPRNEDNLVVQGVKLAFERANKEVGKPYRLSTYCITTRSGVTTILLTLCPRCLLLLTSAATAFPLGVVLVAALLPLVRFRDLKPVLTRP